jgi:hypothetical protein
LLRILAAALAGCSAGDPPQAEPGAVAAAVDHAETELARSRSGAAEPSTESSSR